MLQTGAFIADFLYPAFTFPTVSLPEEFVFFKIFFILVIKNITHIFALSLLSFF